MSAAIVRIYKSPKLISASVFKNINRVYRNMDELVACEGITKRDKKKFASENSEKAGTVWGWLKLNPSIAAEKSGISVILEFEPGEWDLRLYEVAEVKAK